MLGGDHPHASARSAAQPRRGGDSREVGEGQVRVQQVRAQAAQRAPEGAGRADGAVGRSDRPGEHRCTQFPQARGKRTLWAQHDDAPARDPGLHGIEHVPGDPCEVGDRDAPQRRALGAAAQ